MHAILTLALKDLRLQSRDWFGLFWIAVFPLMLALFFGSIFAGSGGPGRAISLAVVDQVQSTASKAFLRNLEASTALRAEPMTLADARTAVIKGKKVAYLVLVSGFGDGDSLFGGEPRKLQLGIDPSRRADAEVIKGLVMKTVFVEFQDVFTSPDKAREQARRALKEIETNPDLGASRELFRGFFGELDRFLDRLPALPGNGAGGGFSFVDLDVQDTISQGDIPRNAYAITFPSSILWAMIGCVTSFAIALVIERQQGTFLRLRTAPLSLGQLLAGKGLACFLSCVGVTVLLLAFAALFLGVHLGNLLLLTLAIFCTSLCFTGLMMFVSTLGKTEQSVAGAGWGIMMPLAMLGGGMVPLIFMPSWMLTASHASPVKWGILALEGAMWRRFTFTEMLTPCGILLAVGAVSFGVGVLWLKKQEG